jgi:uncharacterized protein YihD (DUF1040 family)
MSSFDYTDNFSGFNDLINRADFLTEMADTAKKAISQLAKTKDGKVGLNDLIKMYQHKTKGTSPAASYAKNMLWLVAMAAQDFITDEQKEFIKSNTNMGSSTAFAKAVQTVAPEATEALYGEEQKSEDLIKFVADNSIVLLRRAIMNMPGDNFIYIGPDVEDKELDAAVSSQKVEDDIEDVADTIGGDFKKEIDEIVSADPTTFIEIKIQDMDRAEDVSKMVSRYANEDGVEITNDGVQFSIDPEMPLAIAAKNLALKGLEQKIESELQGDISRVTDNIVILHLPQKVIDQAETELRFKDLPGAEEDYEQDMYGMEGNESYAANENEVQEDNEEERQRRENEREEARDRAREAEDKGDWEKWNEEENKRELARDRLREIEDNELDHFLTKEQPEDDIPATDYESVIADLVSKDKKEHALKQLNGDKDDGGHIDDMRAEYPPDPFGGGYEDEEFNYSPMLDSYKTSTADYLTEQAASDKRNKKTEVKPQSFKEKYKPKTHWQLEELRRYGL